MLKRIWGIGLIILSLAVLGAQANQPLTLLITEVFYDTPGADGEREWIEIANVGTAVLDLSDVKIGDEETAGGNEGMHRFPDLARIEPGQAVVVAQSAAGFRELYTRNPDYEINDTDPNVPDMRGFPLWAGGDLALANDGDEVLLLQGMAVLDAINYGDSHAYFSPAIGDIVTGQSIERFPANCDTDTAADWQPQTTPAPGSISLDGNCAAPVNPAELDALPPIGAIQGDGDASPFINQIITFRGVVTGAYEDRNASGVTFYTLFVQDAPGYEDGDPDTSDGMAVFLGRKRPSYQPGDQVRITGLVAEFFGYTEIDDAGLEIRVEAGDTPLPAPIAITPPTGAGAQAAYFEPLESMLVALDGAARVVGPTYSGCGFTVVRADSGLERVFRRRAADPAGPVVTVLHHSDVHCDGFPDVRVGDGVKGVRGPLIYNFDQFKIVQQETDGLAVTAVPLPALPAPPMPSGAQFSVATFNVENYFDSLDDTGTDAEPKPTDDEIAAKQTKLAYAIGHTLGCPTLIGVQEVEKESLLLDLAAATADVCGFTYNITHRESPDARGIDVALLNDPRRVTVTGTALRQGCTLIDTGIDDETITCEPGKQPLFSRPPLQVDVTIDGVGYTIFVNHFKSKRGGEAATASRRLAQAQHIVAQVNGLRAQDAAARIIVLGDFNDYEQSPPLELMTTEGALTNVLLRVPEAERYSFVFGGVSQLIDGVLVSANVAAETTAVTILHASADYPDSLGNDTSQAGLAYKATDHDLPLALINLAEAETDAPSPTSTSIPIPTDAYPSPEKPGPDGNPPNWWAWLVGVAMVVGTAVLALLFRRQH